MKPIGKAWILALKNVTCNIFTSGWVFSKRITYSGTGKYCFQEDCCVKAQGVTAGEVFWYFVVVVQWPGHVQIFATPCTAACQVSLSITNSWSLLKLMSIESVMPSNHLILCHPLLLLPLIFLASVSFQISQFFTTGGHTTGVSAPASVLPMNIQDWFPLGLTGWIFLQSKGLSRVLSNITVQKHQFFSTQLSDYWKNHSFD